MHLSARTIFIFKHWYTNLFLGQLTAESVEKALPNI